MRSTSPPGHVGHGSSKVNSTVGLMALSQNNAIAAAGHAASAWSLGGAQETLVFNPHRLPREVTDVTPW